MFKYYLVVMVVVVVVGAFFHQASFNWLQLMSALLKMETASLASYTLALVELVK